MAEPVLPAALRAVIGAQCGIVTRRQCEQLGVSLSRQRHLVSSGRWRRLHPGVYATHTGQVAEEATVIAALHAVGGEVAASHETSLWLADRRGWLGPTVHLAVPRHRNVTAPARVRLHYLAHLTTVGDPPRIATEASLLDVTQAMRSAGEVVGVVCRLVGGRRTTPDRVRAALSDRRAHPWRALLSDMLTDVADGAVSPLEIADLRNDRAHWLPTAQRQVFRRAGGQGRWLDAVVRGPGGAGLVVKELDGRLGHEDTGRFRDMGRDNASTVGGGRPLRFGWADETDHPCETAALQALLWRRLGAAGTGRACSRPGCHLEARVARLAREHPLLRAG